MDFLLVIGVNMGAGQAHLRQVARQFLILHHPALLGARSFQPAAPANIEQSFVCPNCDREMPLAASHLDHIVPQVNRASTIHGAQGHRAMVATNQNFYKCVLDLPNRSFRYRVQFPHTLSVGMDGANSIDLCNLQLLCCTCNVEKGATQWPMFAPGKQPQPLCDVAVFNGLWNHAGNAPSLASH
jgi:5-methylcytosine-specific restriction endonuclease McrA